MVVTFVTKTNGQGRDVFHFFFAPISLDLPQWRGPNAAGSAAFDADDLPWLQAFADQAAIVLHLHQLVEENRAFAATVAERNQQLEVQVAEQARELTTLRHDVARDQLRHDYPEIIGTAMSVKTSTTSGTKYFRLETASRRSTSYPFNTEASGRFTPLVMR